MSSRRAISSTTLHYGGLRPRYNVRDYPIALCDQTVAHHNLYIGHAQDFTWYDGYSWVCQDCLDHARARVLIDLLKGV